MLHVTCMLRLLCMLVNATITMHGFFGFRLSVRLTLLCC